MIIDEKITTNVVQSNYYKNYKNKVVSADEAVKVIKSGDKIIIHANCAFPIPLVNAMVNRKDELEDVKIYHALSVGDLPYLDAGMEKHFRHVGLFLGHNSRVAVNAGRADTIPIYLFQTYHSTYHPVMNSLYLLTS